MREDKTGDVYKIDRGIKIKEQSSVSSEADHGIIWFRDSDGQPMFTTSGGTTFPVASPPGADWQDSVLDRYDPTGGLPGGPATGARYISTATANGWTDKYIYEYNGSTWDETVPNEGFATWVEDEDKWYFYNGTNWVIWGNVLATTTAPVNVTKAAAAAGTSSELARQDHKHDISTTTAGAATPGDSAAEGSATSLARSDHKHSLPAFGTGAGTFAQGNDSRIDGAVQKSLFDAHTLLTANSDNTPAALTVAEQRLVGRITAGNITGLTVAQVKTLLGIVDAAYGDFYRVGSAAYPILTQSVWHALDSVTSGLASNLTYIGGASANDISAYATHDAGASTKVTVGADPSLSVGDIITIVNTTNYNAVFEVIEIVDTTNFVIDQAWSGFDDAAGRWGRPAQLKVNTGFGGDYRISWKSGVTIATSAAEMQLGIYAQKVLADKSPLTISNTTDIFQMHGSKNVAVAEDERIWLGYLNNTNTNNPSFQDLTFSVERL